MQELLFDLTWLIPLFPFLGFFLIILFTQEHEKLSHSISIGAIGLSWFLGWGVAFSAFATPHLGEHPVHFQIPWVPTASTWLNIGTWIDPLAAVMLFMVPFVCLMIFIYAVGYMGYGTDHIDPHYSRFFAYISLFAAGMLGLIISDSFLTLFISWEVMGLCSYLLIGFWLDKNYPDPDQITPREAGLKAFLVTKVGDLFLLLGLIYLHVETGSFSYDVVFSAEVLHTLAENTVTLPLLGSWSVASVIALLIFGGVVGKSAQFPLHVWLPDAMEGPTPVSALIHAATMVSAGVFLVARIFPLLNVVVQLDHHNPTMGVIAFIGAFTAFFASTIAVAQNDIKGVLAFSTISQLGYMVAALGIGAYVAGTFHLLTHAFFKALLFLGSGSVIIGCHHEQDMMEMGGLKEKMPVTFWTFIAGGFALSGFPIITAGFWSKDEILAHAWEEFMHLGIVSWPFFVWLLLTLAAFLTSFYTGRQIWLTFLGKPRGHHAEHAHESPRTMTVPLMLLAFFALTLGYVGIPEEIIGPGRNWFHHFVGHSFPATQLSVTVMTLSALLALGGLFLSWLIYGRKGLQSGAEDPLVKALGPAHKVLKNKYYVDELYQATIVRGSLAVGSIFHRVDSRWVIDPFVNLVGRFGLALARVSSYLDDRFVDGAVHLTARVITVLSRLYRLFDIHVINAAVDLVGRVTEGGGLRLRKIQTGRVQNYLMMALVTVLVMLGVYVVYF